MLFPWRPLDSSFPSVPLVDEYMWENIHVYKCERMYFIGMCVFFKTSCTYIYHLKLVIEVSYKFKFIRNHVFSPTFIPWFDKLVYSIIEVSKCTHYLLIEYFVVLLTKKSKDLATFSLKFKMLSFCWYQKNNANDKSQNWQFVRTFWLRVNLLF